MQQLIFKNNLFRFNDGLNLTIRRGVKFIHSDCETELINQKTRDYKIVNVTHVKIKRFVDIYNFEFLKHHLYNNKAQVLEAMRKIYYDFDEKEIVTLIFFEV